MADKCVRENGLKREKITDISIINKATHPSHV